MSDIVERLNLDHSTLNPLHKEAADEINRLRKSVNFNLSDTSRMLCKEDVVDVCHSVDLCFDTSDRVRCGPCAVKASAALGVEIDDTHSHLPEVCRLRRALSEAEKVARAKALGEAAEAIFVMGAWSPHYEKLTPNTFDEGTSAAYEIVRELQGKAESALQPKDL